MGFTQIKQMKHKKIEGGIIAEFAHEQSLQ